MSRITELKHEIERLLDYREALDAASDATTNEICSLRRELDELQDMAAMRETRRDRAWANWRSL